MSSQQNIKIITPKGGEPTWIVVLAWADTVLGSLTFKDKGSMDMFLEKYLQLSEAGFGLLKFDIDSEPSPNEF